MTENGVWDGPKDGPVMVSFGPENHQEMHLVTAERMLKLLSERNRKLFRDLMAEALLGGSDA